MKSLDNPEGDKPTRLPLAKPIDHLLPFTRIARAIHLSIIILGQVNATPPYQEESTGPEGAKSRPEIVAKPLT
jgi:hypothetical protein